MPIKVGITSRFNAYKKQGLTDTKAMQRAMNDQAAYIAKIRKTDAAKKKKDSWVSKLKMAVTGELAKKKHSPAGRKYLGRKK